MLLARVRVSLAAVVAVALVHAILSVALWLWMAGVTGLGFKDKANWTSLDHAQAAVVPVLAQGITLPGRLLLPVVTNEFGLVALLLTNSALWGIVLVWLYSLLRSRYEQHNP